MPAYRYTRDYMPALHACIPTHTHACTHTPMHTCTLRVQPNPTARTLVFLEDSALRLMLGLCPTFLKILWGLANGPRPRAGCFRSPCSLPHHPGRVPRARARPMACLPFQFLLLGLPMFGGSSKLMVSTQLQESSVTFLILPVSEDLKFKDCH